MSYTMSAMRASSPSTPRARNLPITASASLMPEPFSVPLRPLTSALR